MQFLSLFRALALAMGAMVLVAALFGAFGPARYVECVTDKLTALEARAGEVDTLFLGSSRVHHNYAPGVFDRGTARSGVPTRSFNLGAPGMRLAETHYLLERLLERGIEVDWIFVELDEFYTPAFDVNAGTGREIYWHDVRHTRMALQSVHRAPEGGRSGLLDNVGHDAAHVRAFVQRTLNLGVLSQWIHAGGTAAELTTCLGPLRDGHAPLPPKPSEPRYYSLFERRLAAKLDEFYAARRAAPPAAAVDPFHAELIGAVRDVAHRIGAVPVFVVSPLPADRRDLLAAARADTTLLVLDFSDPEKYPELQTAALLHDWTHLNAVGARAFSSALAREFVASTAGGGGRP